MSSLVRAEAASSLTHAETKSSFYELSTYETNNLQEYFNQNGIMFPVETLIEKSQQKDYSFFLQQKNFLKVADSLEKFQECLDLDQPESKEFILFKKKLYNTYEVQNRSTLEHTEYSGETDALHLHHLHESNRYHIEEMKRESLIERMAEQSTLKGKFYKRKMLSSEKV